MKTEDLQQFKGVPLDTKSAEAYAKVRLGLGDDWCAYAWSLGIDKHSTEEIIDEISKVVDDGEDLNRSLLCEICDEMSGLDPLHKNQMIVKLVNAPNLNVAREAWDNEEEIETKVFLVDWDLLQDFLK